MKSLRKCLAVSVTSVGLALPALVTTFPARGEAEVAKCERKYGDDEVRLRLIAQKFEASDALIHVNWKDCIYYIVAWPQPVTPDAQRIYLMDDSGNIKPRPPL